jgi:hypothetical protein
LAVQLQTGKNGFKAFLYQVRVPSLISPLCSCGFGHQTAKHFIIHCRNSLAARLIVRDNHDYLPCYELLVMTLTGLKKVTIWVIEREMLGQYQKARGLIYPPGPSSPANNYA